VTTNRMNAYEYAESMSVYSFPSGSHTLCPISISCAHEDIVQLYRGHSLGTECSIEDDRKRMIAGRVRSVTKGTYDQLLTCVLRIHARAGSHLQKTGAEVVRFRTRLVARLQDRGGLWLWRRFCRWHVGTSRCPGDGVLRVPWSVLIVCYRYQVGECWIVFAFRPVSRGVKIRWRVRLI
jgi:hypothetical protein